MSGLAGTQRLHDLAFGQTIAMNQKQAVLKLSCVYGGVSFETFEWRLDSFINSVSILIKSPVGVGHAEMTNNNFWARNNLQKYLALQPQCPIVH